MGQRGMSHDQEEASLEDVTEKPISHEESEENRKGIFRLRRSGQGIPVPGNDICLAMGVLRVPVGI